MTVYTFSQARQRLAALLKQARQQGEVRIRRRDGQVFVVDPKGEYLVRFVARRVEPSPERPHGLNNAHPVRESRRPGGAAKDANDHRHRMDRVRPYRFRDAVTLVEDFWVEVDRFLKEKGVV